MIVQRRIPYAPFPLRPLPGVQPFDPVDWLLVDDAFAAQMAERARLLAAHRDRVVWADPVAEDALQELLEVVLEALPEGYQRSADAVTRPDGVTVPLAGAPVIETLCLLVQEDLCLLLKEGEEHVLRAASLCFPAAWTLAEKAGQPLVRIHQPVDSYDTAMARRVQRLFDGVQAGRPLWRWNAHWYADPVLFRVRPENDPRHAVVEHDAPFLRSERQCILRLPRTRAVVFSIHTFMLARADVPTAEG